MATTNEATNNEVLAFKHLGTWVRAIECFDRAIAINPRDPEAWNNKGLTLRHKGDHQEAIKCLEEAKRKGGKNAEQALKDFYNR